MLLLLLGVSTAIKLKFIPKFLFLINCLDLYHSQEVQIWKAHSNIDQIQKKYTSKEIFIKKLFPPEECLKI